MNSYLNQFGVHPRNAGYAVMNYVPALDGLRAVAIIFVVANHVFGANFPGGFIGVDVFFVLSGFLITRLFVIEQESTGTIHLPSFFIRRALRLIPALGVMVIFLLILAGITHDRSRLGRDAIEALIAVSYTTNLWLGIQTPSTNGLFDNAWSLAVEEQFYICWGIGAFILLRFGSRHIATTLLGFSVVLIIAWRWHLLLNGAAPMRIYVGFDTRADQLLIGCLGAVLSAQLAPAVTRFSGPAALIALIIIGFCAKAYYVSPIAGLMDFGIIMTVTALLTLVVILDLVSNAGGLLSQVLSFRPLVYIGSISYGIYLWHWPLLEIAKNGGKFNIGAYGNILIAAGSLLVAAFSYHYVERPVLNLKRHFAPRSPSPEVPALRAL